MGVGELLRLETHVVSSYQQSEGTDSPHCWERVDSLNGDWVIVRVQV